MSPSLREHVLVRLPLHILLVCEIRLVQVGARAVPSFPNLEVHAAAL
jgi:hypothetical protein